MNFILFFAVAVAVDADARQNCQSAMALQRKAFIVKSFPWTELLFPTMIEGASLAPLCMNFKICWLST